MTTVGLETGAFFRPTGIISAAVCRIERVKTPEFLLVISATSRHTHDISVWNHRSVFRDKHHGTMCHLHTQPRVQGAPLQGPLPSSAYAKPDHFWPLARQK
jgi:hypothetical protein